MKVKIGITTRNRASILSKAIESGLNQNYPDKELAVFNDASEDATAAVVSTFPGVAYQRVPQQVGLIDARNRLMQQTDAEFYVSLDDDAWFIRRDEIAVAVEFMRKHPKVAAVGFDIVENGDMYPVERSKPIKASLFIGCGHVLRLSHVRQVGYYVTGPGLYGWEEKDLCIRLMDAGYEIYYLPGVQVFHERIMVGRDESAQFRSRVLNDLAFCLRRTPVIFSLPQLVWKCYYNLKFGKQYKQTPATIEGMKDFFRLLPKLLGSIQPVSLSTYMAFHRANKEFKRFGGKSKRDDAKNQQIIDCQPG